MPLLHHVATAALIYGSMMNGYMQFGLLVLFVHDVSDIPLDFMLMSNMLKLEGPPFLFFVEISFVVNAFTWAYFRLYVFPFYLIDSALIGFHTLCADAHNGDILANLFPSTMPFWLFANVMLVFLAVLHVWWFYLILRIAYKLIMGIKAADIADDEYEGEAGGKKTK